MKKVLYKAPIDNKSVLTDFTEVFHNGDCLCRKGAGGMTIEYFVVEECLCSVSYHFGHNRFRVCVEQFNNDLNYHRAVNYFQECINNLYHDNVTQELLVKKENIPGILKDGSYGFYFLVQED